MSNDDIKVSIPKDGGIPTIEGSHALAVERHYRRTEDDGIEVKYDLHPAGDNAMHAGSATVTVLLTKPELVPNSPVDIVQQGTIGAEYSVLMLNVIPQLLTQDLEDAFSEAVKDQVTSIPEHEAGRKAAEACMLVAKLLLFAAGGDKDKAKAEAVKIKDHADDDMLGRVALDAVLAAIELCDVSDVNPS